jgi:uncharacterized membrane protein (UPF0127 family)
VPSLLCDGAVIAPAEVAYSRRARLRGLLGRSGVDGAFVLPGVKGVHTFGMRFPIDVAFVDRRGRVIDVVTMRRQRMGRRRWRSAMVIEAEAGALERWSVRKGSRLEVR